MKKMTAFLICIFIIGMLCGCYGFHGTPVPSEHEYGTVEYAFDEWETGQITANADTSVRNLEYKYQLVDDYIFAVTITENGWGGGILGCKENGAYTFRGSLGRGPKVLIPESGDIIWQGDLYKRGKYGEDYVFVYNSKVGSVVDEEYEKYGANEVNTAKIELYDNKGEQLAKVQGGRNASFFDIKQLDELNEDFEVYAVYEDEIYPIIDYSHIERYLK